MHAHRMVSLPGGGTAGASGVVLLHQRSPLRFPKASLHLKCTYRVSLPVPVCVLLDECPRKISPQIVQHASGAALTVVARLLRRETCHCRRINGSCAWLSMFILHRSLSNHVHPRMSSTKAPPLVPRHVERSTGSQRQQLL